MVDDEELYKLLYDELQDVDKFIEYLNKKIFDYIQARWKNAMEMGAWDSDNMWYEPNKRFVKWFQINNIDPDSKVLKKDETNNALWAIADDMRLRKKEGEFETYREAYRWAEKNISKKGVTITAIKLERSYTKEEIIALYFNEFDFLYGANGIKSAAKIYFDKSPSNLDINEAAMLVRMLKNPSRFNPKKYPCRDMVGNKFLPFMVYCMPCVAAPIITYNVCVFSCLAEMVGHFSFPTIPIL